MSPPTQRPIPFPIESDWTAPSLAELPSWRDASRVAVDVETRDPDLGDRRGSRNLGPGVRRAGSYVVGVSFAIEDGPSAYLPVAHEGGGNLDPERTWAYLREQAATFEGTIVGHNLSYDLDWLAQNGVVYRRAAWFRDTQIAAPLLYELYPSYALDAVARREGIPGKEYALLDRAAEVLGVDRRRDLWMLPANLVGDYAEQDARLPLVLLRRMERRIEEGDLWGIYDLESRVLPVLVKMTRRGVRVDLDGLDRVAEWALGEERRAAATIRAGAAVPFEVDDAWKAEACAAALRSVGISPRLTPKTRKPSVTSGLLERSPGPVPRALLRARQMNKMRTTFVRSIRDHLVNGRLHPTINQLKREDEETGKLKGARSGRTSMEHVNLQQQYGDRYPELKEKLRTLYLPEEGSIMAAPDYSQQEPRLAVHYAYLSRDRSGRPLPGAREARDEYHRNPDLDFHSFMARVTGLERRRAKDVFLGSVYGMGGAKLCVHYMDLPTKMRRTKSGHEYLGAGDEGQAIIDQFHARVPWVRPLSWRIQDVIKARGYVRTILGRRINFPLKADGTYDWLHKGTNGVVQGSAADQTKASLVALDAEGAFVQLTEHDENVGSVADWREARRWGEIMRDVVQLEVPVKVDVEVSPTSWGAVRGICLECGRELVKKVCPGCRGRRVA
jgi:DNA polymerase I-like protein with 3'-5' exonuclease and polymerase domains